MLKGRGLERLCMSCGLWELLANILFVSIPLNKCLDMYGNWGSSFPSYEGITIFQNMTRGIKTDSR